MTSNVTKRPEIDTTPEIHYREGVAVRVTQPINVNGKIGGSHIYRIKDGAFTEEHFMETHGHTREREVYLAELLDREEENPGRMPYGSILGSEKREVDAILNERGIEARSVGTF